jgi:hypothetical protein
LRRGANSRLKEISNEFTRMSRTKGEGKKYKKARERGRNARKEKKAQDGNSVC